MKNFLQEWWSRYTNLYLLATLDSLYSREDWGSSLLLKLLQLLPPLLDLTAAGLFDAFSWADFLVSNASFSVLLKTFIREGLWIWRGCIFGRSGLLLMPATLSLDAWPFFDFSDVTNEGVLKDLICWAVTGEVVGLGCAEALRAFDLDLVFFGTGGGSVEV